MKASLVISLLFLEVAGHASMALAQSPGTFTQTGNLSISRNFHTSTLLTNGKVLIAGGTSTPGGSPVLASAELYDPSTGTFTATGSMVKARFFHTATLLPNGMVLIAGGNAEASAELYDPSTGTFTATGDMTKARVAHTATLLNSGKVLIAGGYRQGTQAGDCCETSVELYDPSTGTFAATGDMTKGRALFPTTLLPNGKVLIGGGYNGGTNSNQGSFELYEPDRGTFSAANMPAYPDLFPVTANLLTNGKVLITLAEPCEDDLDNPLCYFGDLAEVYDPSTGIFEPTGNMAKSRQGDTATLLPEGKVLIAGRDSTYGGSAELYDPVTGTFSVAGDVPTQGGHAATLLSDGTVLLSGGFMCCATTIASTEIYHPAVLVPRPVLFSLFSDGQGPGAILHGGTHQIVSADNPAAAGEALEIYGAGLIDGGLIPPQVAIGGRMAEVLFFGQAPGYKGLNQINVRVPGGLAPGSAVSVRLNYLGRPSNEVTIGVR